MQLKIHTEPAQEPITATEAKEFARIDTTVEDLVIEGLIKAARIHAEAYTRRQFVTATWNAWLDGWPGKNYIELPLGRLQSVVSVVYTDSDAVAATLVPNTEYLVDTNSEKGKIFLPYGETWPSFTPFPVNAIAIRFICGFGDRSAVPMAIKTAIKMIFADMYGNREAQTTDVIYENKMSEKLLAPYKFWRV